MKLVLGYLCCTITNGVSLKQKLKINRCVENAQRSAACPSNTMTTTAGSARDSSTANIVIIILVQTLSTRDLWRIACKCHVVKSDIQQPYLQSVILYHSD